MADGKRAGAGPKVPVATPNIGGISNTVSLDTALGGCLGARIRVMTALNIPLEGTLFVADPITNLIAINTASPPPTPISATSSAQPGDYHILPIASLQSFQLLSLAPEAVGSAGSTTFDAALPSIRSLDMRALKARERAAVDKEIKRERARGKGVGREAQEIYDALSRTLPVRWHEQSIVVLDSVMISPPYGSDDCRAASKDTSALQRVKKVLEMEKKKLAERHSHSSSGGAATTAANRLASSASTPAVLASTTNSSSTAAPAIAGGNAAGAGGGARKGG